LRGSIENGDGNFAGLLAEYIAVDAFGATRSATYERDLWCNGLTIDVKTKRRTVKPKPKYEASISDFNTSQSADVYYFTSYNTENSIISLLGYLPTEDYYDKATYHEAGELDPDNNFEFKDDCYNVRYSELKQCEIVALEGKQ